MKIAIKVKDKAEIRAGKGFKEDSLQSLGEPLAEKKVRNMKKSSGEIQK